MREALLTELVWVRVRFRVRVRVRVRVRARLAHVVEAVVALVGTAAAQLAVLEEPRPGAAAP